MHLHHDSISLQDKVHKRLRSIVERALNNYDKIKICTESGNGKNRRAPGAGRKPLIPEVGAAAFRWFVDVRAGLKGRISRKLFQAKCVELRQAALARKRQQGEVVMEEEENMKFTKPWVRRWMRDYRVSLRKPNKRIALPQATRKRRILQFLKNVYRIRHYFTRTYHVDPTIWSGDQMPLHRLESSGSKTLGFTGMDCHIKENYMHSRERLTVFTQMSSSNQVRTPKPEFVFKGKGLRVQLNPPRGIKFQWSESGSYRLPHVLQSMKNLPTAIGPMERHLPDGMKKWRVYTLDDYSAHLDASVAEQLYRKGYIFLWSSVVE